MVPNVVPTQVIGQYHDNIRRRELIVGGVRRVKQASYQN
jgi:hypothetical protein